MTWTSEDVTRVLGVAAVGACAVACVVRGDMANGAIFAAILSPGIIPHKTAPPAPAKDGAP